jgi:tripartite-type tricarboxylate transporter receptor subunit TctC
LPANDSIHPAPQGPSTRTAKTLKLLRRFMTTAVAALSAAGAIQTGAWGQTFPNKPIHLIVATPAGGPLDALARIAGEGASRSLGQTIIVESRVGGTGAVAMQYLLQQPADGYTIHLTANAAFALTPLLRKMPHKPIDDFSFIGRMAFAPSVLAVPASLPVNTLQEFVALAKAKPGQLNYGMMLGVPQHVDFEKFKRATGSDIVLVPYTGGAPIVNDMLGTQVQATLLNAALFTEYIKAGKIRGLATTSAKRLPSLPDVPTLAEAGFPNLNLDEGVHYALVGPAGMPKPVVDKLYQAFTTALADPEISRKLAAIGFDVSPRDGLSFKQDMRRELAANEKTIKALNIKLND